MKLSEFKESIKERLLLLKAGMVFTAQREFAYAGNNWSRLLSTLVFTISMLIFVKVLYSNVQTIAGYSYNEMLLYFFIYQMTYYANFLFTVTNLNNLIPDINNGNLDMVLIKPVPSLFFLMTRTISLVSIITDALAPMLAISLSINWSSLDLSLSNLLIGFCIWILGLIALQTLQILSVLPAFWFGESQNILDLVQNSSAACGTTIPLEGYGQTLRTILATIFPMLIASGFTVSILLEKSNVLLLLVWALVIAILSIIVKNIAWKFALKHYTSASS